MRNQIVSITMNESQIEDGNQIATLFYREFSSGANESDTLKFKNFTQTKSWDVLLAEAIQEKNIDIFSLQHSAKNIGGFHN